MKIDFFRHLSIKTRLMLSMLIVSVFSVVLCTLIYIWLVSNSKKEELVSSLKVQAKLVAEYAVSPLAFDDLEGLEEVLNKIKTIENVEYGCVFDRTGNKVLAVGQQTVDFKRSSQDSVVFIDDFLSIQTPISYKEENYGSLAIIANTKKLKENTASIIQNVFIFSFFLVFLNILLIIPLQEAVIEPILSLASKMKYISQTKDYKTRVEKMASDEIGDLTDNFNELMQTISNQQIIQEEAEKDLTEMTKELIKHNNELQRFAYITSHDLRAPVVNLVKLLEFVDRESLNEINSPIFEKIRTSILKLNETLNDLIQVVSAQKSLNNEIEKISFDKFVKEVLLSIENQVKDSKAVIYTDWQVKEINYVRAHLNSIFINVLTNAIKYRHPERNPEIKIKTYTKEKYICIEISDNGLGIDLKHNNKNYLFGLHKRFHTNIEGKGIGLFLVKTLVESLDGTVDAESEVDKGTTFFIYLKDKV